MVHINDPENIAHLSCEVLHKFVNYHTKALDVKKRVAARSAEPIATSSGSRVVFRFNLSAFPPEKERVGYTGLRTREHDPPAVTERVAQRGEMNHENIKHRKRESKKSSSQGDEAKMGERERESGKRTDTAI